MRLEGMQAVYAVRRIVRPITQFSVYSLLLIQQIDLFYMLGYQVCQPSYVVDAMYKYNLLY